MDLTESIAPKSDQLNADDLITGPVTVTIQEVTRGTAEQPVDVRLVEFPGRPYKPSKSMRRVMVMAWGPESSMYAGRTLTLYRNPEIRFGSDKVGGIEISSLSHIDKPLTVSLTATRGKKKSFTVKPFATPAPALTQDISGRMWLDELALAGDDVDAIAALGKAAAAAHATAADLDAIRGRYNEIKGMGA